ncbi:MAG: hypothetical protein ACJ8EZ_00800 [Sphingomicrobium sp.]
MKLEKIDDKARVWILTRGPDGRLEEQLDETRLDPQFLSAIGAAATAEEIADVIAIAAGQMELAESRLW